MRGIVFVVLAACGSAKPMDQEPGAPPEAPPPPTPADAAPAAPAEPGPEPGSAGDVLGRVFDLAAREPAIPRAFGGLRPGMSRAEAEKARPRDWNGWERALSDEPGVTLTAAVGTKLDTLTVHFEQRGAQARLERAWGAPAARAYNASASCWLAPATHLKACHLAIDGHAIELAAYLPLSEALGPKGRRQLGELAGRLGATRAEVQRAYPDAVELFDTKEPKDPALHRLEVPLAPTEYSADVRPDRLSFFLDGKDRVREVAVRYGANDPERRPELVERVRAAAKALDVSVTVVEDEPVDIVVVLDAEDGLK